MSSWERLPSKALFDGGFQNGSQLRTWKVVCQEKGQSRGSCRDQPIIANGVLVARWKIERKTVSHNAGLAEASLLSISKMPSRFMLYLLCFEQRRTDNLDEQRSLKYMAVILSHGIISLNLVETRRSAVVRRLPEDPPSLLLGCRRSDHVVLLPPAIQYPTRTIFSETLSNIPRCYPNHELSCSRQSCKPCFTRRCYVDSIPSSTRSMANTESLPALKAIIFDVCPT